MVLGILKKAFIRRKTKTPNDLTRRAEMSEVAMLRGTEPREILQIVIDKKVSAIMSYLSKGKWHVAKVLPTNLGANRLDIQLCPGEKPHPINIQIDQPVGISLKHGYGKFIFETTVIGLEASPVPSGSGTIVLAMPNRMEFVQRRSYFRVSVPAALKVNVMLWHRSYADDNSNSSPEHYWQGKLIDISAGGAQIVVDAAQNPDFRKGQFIGMRFTPMPYETPLMFNAQIRNILPTADNKSICLGLQTVGLEASSEGHQVLQRLCNVVEQYYQLNQSSVKQQDIQPACS